MTAPDQRITWRRSIGNRFPAAPRAWRALVEYTNFRIGTALWKLNRLSGLRSERSERREGERPRLLKSSLCTQRQLESEPFRTWVLRMREEPRMHRKQWEWAFISQALHERGLLRPGSRGLAFATGREPLPALFASYGCEIVASDWHEEAAREAGWVTTDQHASEVEVLNERGICPPEQFRSLVSFRIVDMNDIPGDLRNFDFLWSACSLEHLGSIAHGERFIQNAMECLKPGGVAVHTTEFNVSSDWFTTDHSPAVVFRRRDLERIARTLTAAGHDIQLDLVDGRDSHDLRVDLPPFTGSSHLKLLLGPYVSTSAGLIIRKGSPVGAGPATSGGGK